MAIVPTGRKGAGQVSPCSMVIFMITELYFPSLDQLTGLVFQL